MIQILTVYSLVNHNKALISTPNTRIKGEIACYSCFSKDYGLISSNKQNYLKKVNLNKTQWQSEIKEMLNQV